MDSRTSFLSHDKKSLFFCYFLHFLAPLFFYFGAVRKPSPFFFFLVKKKMGVFVFCHVFFFFLFFEARFQER